MMVETQSNTFAWYASLVKPSFAPPSFIFGIAWSILYPIIFGTFIYVLVLVLKKKIPAAVIVPFVLNLIFNLIFSPIQFVLQNNFLAAVDILMVLGTLIWSIKSVAKYSKAAVWLQIPYLLWVSFATILQLSITYLNI